ncbi:hypothetical protein IQ265_06985 [Nodosilinea sp. LEGE 06152]|uniref:hypothetical protein n=1 Tax=Nodosilinea sp. LEGE 06152 TaxID=2777966 RepID=UPI0018817D74|nr:hypothetical protein [Nodosilinea sp. LEGE 06152]MBE9156573.1 hypothetical protein [Nodosilinea sp. LEGE 06152]
MPKYTVDDVLEIICSLSVEEKASLKAQLSTVLEAATSADRVTQQSRSMSVGGNFQVSGSGVTVDMSQRQTVGNSSTDGNADTTQALLQALAALQQQVINSANLNSIEKATAKVPITTLATELEKEKPDKDLIDQSVEALRKGLAGVETLAEPVMRVAGLVAKAMVLL